MKPADRSPIRYISLAAALLIASLIANTRPPLAPSAERYPRASTVAAMDALLQRQVRDRLPWVSVPGASIAVIRDGQLLERHYGSRRAWTDAPLHSSTQFEAASLSKPLTAYAIVRLARRRQLDLDAPLRRAGYTFTIRQILSHSAGFDNDLVAPLEPRRPAGEFAYAGAGYLFLGEIIERTTGQTFAEHMNLVVLPELAMTHSQFGASDSALLALPSIDAGLPFAIMVTIATLVGAPMLLAHAVAARRWRGAGHHASSTARNIIALFALACGALGLRWLFGAPNWGTLILACGALLALGCAAWVMVLRQHIATRLAGAACAALFIGLLIVRPAVPLVERSANFLPAAGLRTTASDYARFLAHLAREAERDVYLEQMLTAQAQANAQNDWGLGLGLQSSATQTVWHWGVNYPGYQALAIANRETGDVAVVLMNGGQLSFSPSGFRYSGLEASRSAIAGIIGGRHSGYWHGIQ